MADPRSPAPQRLRLWLAAGAACAAVAGRASALPLESAGGKSPGTDETAPVDPWRSDDPFLEALRRDVSVVYGHAGVPRIAYDYGATRRGGAANTGIDIAAEAGAPVIAAADGWAHTHRHPLLGPRVKINHALKFVAALDIDGRAVTLPLKVATVYAGLSEIVTAGGFVRRGAVIGRNGDGRSQHLHFEARTGLGGPAQHVNPHLMWANGPGLIACFDAAAAYPRDRLALTYPVACA